jgi:uncharacterized protein (DUF169 family)
MAAAHHQLKREPVAVAVALKETNEHQNMANEAKTCREGKACTSIKSSGQTEK